MPTFPGLGGDGPARTQPDRAGPMAGPRHPSFRHCLRQPPDRVDGWEGQAGDDPTENKRTGLTLAGHASLLPQGL